MSNAGRAKFLKFLATSAFVSLLYWGLLYFLTDIAHIWYAFSMILTTAILAITGFTINYLWTWRVKEKIRKPRKTVQFIKYIVVGGSTTLLGWTQVFILTEFAHLWYLWSSVISSIIVVTLSFLANNYWTYRDAGRAEGLVEHNGRSYSQADTEAMVSKGVETDAV